MLKFQKMLCVQRFTLPTDDKPLLAVFGSKEGNSVCTVNRIECWAAALLVYDVEIRHQSTTLFGRADAQSRLICRLAPQHEKDVFAVINDESPVQ